MLTKTETLPGNEPARKGMAAARAGLVLLCAPELAELPPAIVLTSSTLVIGRAPPPGGLRLRDRTASSLHARITRREDACMLQDLDSRNGTLLNGRALTGTATLADGDLIRIGETIFKFVAANADGYAAFPLDRADGEVVGGFRVHEVLRHVEALAPTDLAIVVHGETGSGKELIARALHAASRRRGPLVALNCAAIPPNLIESELFGYKRGAFTGADRDKTGLVRAADGGTLFLDEIGDMPRESQAKLLRIIETREVLPLGSTQPEPVDVRFVCATHHDLSVLAREGRFRGDLYARLNGATLPLPPLRERKEDLYPLVRRFLERAAGERAPVIGAAFMAGLCQYDWPYNVRELEAATRRALALCKGDVLTEAELPDVIRSALAQHRAAPPVPPPSLIPSAPPSAPPPPPSEAELRELLARHRGNIAAVARELGRDRTQIHRWMRYAGIDPDAFRGPG